MKTAIYCRVSTDEQELRQQIETCKKYCEMKGWNDYEIFTETQSSTKVRPVFDSVIARCRHRDFHELVVFRLDRAWRSSRAFIMDFDGLNSVGVNVISVMEGLDPTTPMGKCMMTILVALAELERTNISVATKQRMTALKNLGKKLGRPVGSKDSSPRRKSGYYMRYSKEKR